METVQTNLFNFLEDIIGKAVPVAKVISPKMHKAQVAAKEVLNIVDELTEKLGENDARTEIQRNSRKKVSIDVGKKVRGAAKDISEMKRKFIASNGDLATFAQIALEDDFLAGQLAEKKHVFSWITDERCKAAGVEVKAFYGMQLLFRRLPVNASATKLDSQTYMQAMNFISEHLQTIRTVQELHSFVHRFVQLKNSLNADMLSYTEKSLVTFEDQIEVFSKQDHVLPEIREANIRRTKHHKKETIAKLHLMEDFSNTFSYLNSLSSFTELLDRSKKRASLFKSMEEKYESWADYELKNNDKEKPKAKVDRRPVWERVLPFEMVRKGGRFDSDFKSPLEFKEHFGYSGVECGHYVKDDVALAHIINSSRAFADLAEILNINDKHMSLNNELSIAFGARGRSAALGHFERGYNVINFTRDKGAFGILSHEWFHAYDFFLMNTLTESNSDYEYLTDTQKVHELPVEVIMALSLLKSTIKDGNAIDTIEINPLNRYRILNATRDIFSNKCNSNMREFVDYRMKEFDERAARSLDGYVSKERREAQALKNTRSRKKQLQQTAEIAAILYKEHSGETISYVPYTSDKTYFYLNACTLDRGRKKYWASDVELMARCFEKYVSTQLNERGWRSDYLVAGLDGFAYPAGDEALRINEAFKAFLDVTLPYLRACK